jgi:addiction module HigA family antidote
MPMKNPPHPGELVRAEVPRSLGLSLTKAAESLGVRRTTLSDLTNGKTTVSPEMLRLEKAFGISMDMLLRMQAGYDAAQARRAAETAGAPPASTLRQRPTDADQGPTLSIMSLE